MKNKDITSAILGSTFFAIPYIGLSVALAPSLVIGGCAFVASELMFSGVKTKDKLKNTNKSLYQKIIEARKEQKQIKNLIPKVENTETKQNLKEINETINKILEEVERKPKKEKKLNNFFDYYLPVLIKITSRYDEIENTRLSSIDEKTFMTKAQNLIKETNKAFKTILSNLYQKDIIDTDADMKVYELMMKADGIVEDNIIKNEVQDEK
ncbi:MAG: 5-bromo-4-chloroindolyl phosphate hydrolysis family protein [Bacilli bacterium]